MDSTTQTLLQGILAKSVPELTEYDIAFLKARSPYLNSEQKTKFAEVLGETVVVAADPVEVLVEQAKAEEPVSEPVVEAPVSEPMSVPEEVVQVQSEPVVEMTNTVEQAPVEEQPQPEMIPQEVVEQVTQETTQIINEMIQAEVAQPTPQPEAPVTSYEDDHSADPDFQG